MMKKLLKITDIATLAKKAYFSDYQRYRCQILQAQIERLNKNCVNISCRYILYFPTNKPSKSVKVGPDRFFVLNDSASPKMDIKMYFKIF